MKKNIIIILILVLAITQTISAQKVSTYTVNTPLCVLEKDAKIYIEGFKYTGTQINSVNFSDKISTNIKNSLTQDFGSKILAMIPWADNTLYTVVANANEATHIVYGDFNYSASAPVSNKVTQKATITEMALSGLYVHYITFSESADVNFTGKIVVKKVGGDDVFSQKFGQKTKASQQSKLVPPKTPLDVNQSINSLAMNVADNSANFGVMGLRIYNQEYKLKKIKISTKEKATKKKIKALEKTMKKTLKANPYNAKEAGKYLLEISALEESPNAKYNIGVCYLALGNLTKAKEYLTTSGISKINIDELIKHQQTLATLGVEITENDF